MAVTDPRIDAYIEQAAEFARPILRHLRALVHAHCAEAEETLKWSMPHYMYRGGILCSMAAFKQHCAFGFWNDELVIGDDANPQAMGQFGRITRLEDLPADETIASYVRKAMALRDRGVKRSRPKSASKPEAVVPDDLRAALAENAQARQHFDAFSPSHRREYVEWIIEAKRPETRAKRLKQTLEWLAEGKPRNWKYMNC